MTTRLATRSLLLLGVLLLAAGCTSPSSVCSPPDGPCDPPPPPRPAPCSVPCPPIPVPCAPGAGPCLPANHCGWPDTCLPTPARALLVQIRGLADAADLQQAIDPQDLAEIHNRIALCLLDNLTNPVTGRHVCDVTAPTGCEELQNLHAEASGMSGHPPKVQRGLWHTLAQELQNFPSGQ